MRREEKDLIKYVCIYACFYDLWSGRNRENIFTKSCCTVFDDKDKLFLANTNPAVDNLRRKVEAQNCEFMTIDKFIRNSRVQAKYDILFMDECSMVSNSDMRSVLKKAEYKLLVLVGDTYQIESITFGNWFCWKDTFSRRKHGMSC